MVHFKYFVTAFLIGVFFSVNAQQTIQKLKISSEQTVNYLLYLPENYAANQAEKFPILLFLHGGGQSGDQIELVKKNGPPALVDQGMKFPFIILSPQNGYKNKFWDVFLVIQLLDSIVKKYRVDTSRIYLSGMSRGGFGAWCMAAQFPDKFAALAVVCGANIAPYAGWIGKMPVWVFHGTDDPLIPLHESVEMVDALRALGNNAKLTVYEGVKHNAWEKAYADPELYKWLLQQKK